MKHDLPPGPDEMIPQYHCVGWFGYGLHPLQIAANAPCPTNSTTRVYRMTLTVSFIGPP